MSVVLPAPLGPSSPKNSPGRDVEVDAGQGGHGRLRVVDASDPARLDGGRSRIEMDMVGPRIGPVEGRTGYQRALAGPGGRCASR